MIRHGNVIINKKGGKEMERVLKLGVWLVALFVLLGVVGVAQAQTQLKELGRSPFFKPELQTVGEFQDMVKETLPDLKKGFATAGASALFDDFVIQVEQSNIEKINVPIGEQLQWMIYKKGQRVEVMKNVIWAGKEPFTAYRVVVEKDGKRHVFVVPTICGNVSLLRSSDLPAAAPAPVVTAPTPPPVVAAPAPATTTDTPWTDPVLKRGNFVVDLGYLHQPDPANYLLMRVGYGYRFHEHFSLLGMIGFAPVIRGDDDTDSFMADLTASYHYDRMYIGGGMGFWHSSRKDRADMIVNAGYRIYGEAYQRNLSLFVEGRIGLDDLNDFNDYVRYGGGLRYQF
ncbi:hypothetical protein C6366_09730 [Desulfonatronum sp. SC1]|nr:hypothetical protein C6366_09730 [Desulfonatronum sp. SC1]